MQNTALIPTRRGYFTREYRGFVDPDYLLADQATSASVVTVVTAFLASMTATDICSQITVLPGGTTADVPAGDVTIVGKDANGAAITEALTFLANATTEQVTVKAFKSVDSVTFPVQDGAGATYDVGLATGMLIPMPQVDMLIKQVRVNFDAAPTSAGNVVGTIESATHAALNTKPVDQTGIAAEVIANLAGDGQFVSKNDEFVASYANPDDQIWGLTIVAERLTSI